MQRNNTVLQYTATRPIMDLFEEELWQKGMWDYKWWWYQEGLVLKISDRGGDGRINGGGGGRCDGSRTKSIQED